MCETIDEYISDIYDTYLAHVVEHNDYETFGHAMAIVLPTFMKLAKDLSDMKKNEARRGELGERTE